MRKKEDKYDFRAFGLAIKEARLKRGLTRELSVDEFFLPANNLVKSTRRLQIEKYMDSFTDKELSLMESLASGINEARNIED